GRRGRSERHYSPCWTKSAPDTTSTHSATRQPVLRWAMARAEESGILGPRPSTMLHKFMWPIAWVFACIARGVALSKRTYAVGSTLHEGEHAPLVRYLVRARQSRASQRPHA